MSSFREGRGADLVSRPSFSSKEAPEEGKGGYILVSVAQLLLGRSEEHTSELQSQR